MYSIVLEYTHEKYHKHAQIKLFIAYKRYFCLNYHLKPVRLADNGLAYSGVRDLCYSRAVGVAIQMEVFLLETQGRSAVRAPIFLWRPKVSLRFYDFLKLFKRNFRRMLSGEISLGEAFSDVYVTFKKLNLRFGGVYLAYKPQFIPLDVQLIKDIMVKSFSHFQDRGSYHHERDRLTQNLFRLEGDTWKRLRVKLSPTFTSSRMKMMFETLCEKIRSLPAVTDQCIRQGGRINLTEIAGRFTTDVIGSCAFGIECDSIRNPDCDFRYVFL